MSHSLTTILAIGGSDPTGGAGIQADIRASARCGVHACTAITVVTAQNSGGLISLNEVSPHVLKAQLQAVSSDIIPDAIKIGMVGSCENIRVIYDFLCALPGEVPIIIDPVIKITAEASNGENNYDKKDLTEIINLYQTFLFPLSAVVTPNIPEGRFFYKSYFPDSNPEQISDLQLAMSLLRLWGCNAVIMKGGHGTDDTCTDILADNFQGNIAVSKSSHRKECCNNLHGTGCVYSSLLASFMALGFPLHDAFKKTSEEMARIIQESCDYKLGESSYGPLNINNYRL